MSKVVFVSYGSLGDILPFVAIAEVLRVRGIDCVFVVNPRYKDAVLDRGFEAHAFVTDASTLFERAGYSPEESVKATRENVDVFWRLAMPEFSNHCPKVESAVAGASAVVGTPWAFNAQSVAEKTGTPFIGAHLWPLGLLSAYDPPVLPELPVLIKAPRSALAIKWNRCLTMLAHFKMRLWFLRILNAPRRTYGLPATRRTPVLDFLVPPAAQMALYSPTYAPSPPDAPPNLTVTGFPVPQRSGKLDDPELETFLQDAPIVFSLGSILSQNPGEFYQHSVMAARALGRKALVLTPDRSGIPTGPDVLVRAFVPHGEVFPKASVVVHHGGIGTTGQALLSGRPQLVVPHFGDQPDNGARLQRLGVARVIPTTAYDAKSAQAALADLLADGTCVDRAQTLSLQMADEDGASRAAEVILHIVQGHGTQNQKRPRTAGPFV